MCKKKNPLWQLGFFFFFSFSITSWPSAEKVLIINLCEVCSKYIVFMFVYFLLELSLTSVYIRIVIDPGSTSLARTIPAWSWKEGGRNWKSWTEDSARSWCLLAVYASAVSRFLQIGSAWRSIYVLRQVTSAHVELSFQNTKTCMNTAQHMNQGTKSLIMKR